MGNCLKSKRQDHRKLNKSIHRKRKFFAGVEFSKPTNSFGAEGNFHLSYNLDKVEKYSDPFKSGNKDENKIEEENKDE